MPFAVTRILLDKNDIEWLKIKPLQMLGMMKDKTLPPQDAYNAGQKWYDEKLKKELEWEDKVERQVKEASEDRQPPAHPQRSAQTSD